jgi:hypothetical protein
MKKTTRIVFGLTAALAALGAAGDQAYEAPPVLKASDFLDAKWLKGSNHEIEETVVSDGVFNTYTIKSKFGIWKVQSTGLAAVRVHEIGAIAQLKEVDKIAVAAGGVAASAVDIGKGTIKVVTHPVDTIAGLGDGVARLFGRVGRSTSRTAEKLGSDDPKAAEYENLSNPADAPKTSEQSTTGKAVEGTGELAKDIIGVNSAMRSWAKKLRVDPYTTNEVLHNELRDVAQYDAGGRFAVNLAPGGVILTALSATSTVNDLIWMKEPDELVTLNEKRLKAMGVKPEVSRAFRLNKKYNLTWQVRLIAALDALGNVPGRPEFVARAAGARVDADAGFYVQSAMLSELFQKTQTPPTSIVANLPGACVTAGEERFACLYPLDYVSWTEGFAGHVDRITKRAQTDFPKARRELWLTGQLSPRAAKEFEARGWTVREKSLKLISEEAEEENLPPAAPEKKAEPATTPAAK